jgi:alanine racemase
MPPDARHLTRACIHLDRLTQNLQLLQELAGDRPLWPAIKANAYGHGLAIIARHLVSLGYDTLCLAHVSEALALVEWCVPSTWLRRSRGRRSGPGNRPRYS